MLSFLYNMVCSMLWPYLRLKVRIWIPSYSCNIKIMGYHPRAHTPILCQKVVLQTQWQIKEEEGGGGGGARSDLTLRLNEHPHPPTDTHTHTLDKKSMYIGLYKTPNKALSCLVLSHPPTNTNNCLLWGLCLSLSSSFKLTRSAPITT